MMDKQAYKDLTRWHLPEGIDDLLPEQTMAAEQMRHDILALFSCWGYQLLTTPLIEYLDTLLCGTGEDVDLQTFKFVDQLSGRMMGVRADITPQIARIDFTRLANTGITRLCYIGTVLNARPQGLDKKRAPIQFGAEIFGHHGTASDIEVIELMIETLQVAGVQNVAIDVGHADIFHLLMRDAGINQKVDADGTESINDNAIGDLLFQHMQDKDKPAIKVLLQDNNCAPNYADMILALVDLHGDQTMLSRAASVLKKAGAEVQAKLQELEKIALYFSSHHPSLTLMFDLSEQRGYRYQSGVVFAAYVEGHGKEIARGGRYDGLSKVYGVCRAATGFSADLITLVSLSNRNDVAQQAIYAPADDDLELRTLIKKLRADGEIVIQSLQSADEDAQDTNTKNRCDRIIQKSASSWQVNTL